MNLNLHKRCANTVYFTVMKYTLLLLFFFSASSLYAQGFAVTAVPSDETCNGNGSLTYSVENTAPGATVNYIVYYLGPMGTSTPVLVQNSSSTTLVGQQDGVYKVEAHQFAGATEILPFAQTTTNIADNTAPLNFDLIGQAILCGHDGAITVNVLAGAAISYELVKPDGTHIGPQASETFTGLDHNTVYNVIVTNGCGVGIPHSITLFEAIPIYQIGGAMFPDIELTACDKLTIGNSLFSTNSVPLTYPFQAKFTVTHFNGTVNVYDITVPGGDALQCSVSTIIDYHYNEPCHYHIEFTDTCGTVTTSAEFNIDPILTVSGEIVNIKCTGKNIKYTFAKFYGPFTIEFVNPPAGFNPADYNDQYPGPYTAGDAPILFGDEDTPLPYGTYVLKIHDGCNRTPDGISGEIVIEIPEIEVAALPYPATCNSGGSVEAVIPGLPIGVAEITSGPPEYSTTYNVDVSAFIQNQATKVRDKVLVGNLPPGDYFIQLTDTCGVTYPPVKFTIKPYNGDGASALARPDCEVGYGTVQVSGAAFDYIEITAAPATYSIDHPLPYDVTSHLHPIDGGLYMDHMPPGQYKFKAHNECDPDIVMPPGFVVIPAYSISADEYNVIRHCGSFDVFLNHQSTGMAFVGFYLQKWDETLGKWKHPEEGGKVYEEGEQIVSGPAIIPLEDRNALKLNNNTTNFNLLYKTGKYRIVKQYITFGDGAKEEMTKYCTPTLYEFEYFSDLFVSGAVSLNCTGNSGDVMIAADGVPPLTYSIVAHDGSPFFVDNGINNIFSGLNSGLYTIEVKDPCGHTQPLTFNVADIPSLVYAADPSDLDSIAVCDQGGDGKEAFDISGYTPLVLDGQDPDDVTVTYHTSHNDADQGINPLPDPTNVVTATATIYARATHELNADCAAVTWFDLIVNPQPDLNMKDKWGGCEGKDVTITADSGFAYYEWTAEAGNLTIVGPDHITVSDAGNYTVTVRDNIGCENSKTVEVVKSPVPVIASVTIDDWTDKDNVLTVVMAPTTLPTHYEYSLDNIHFQASPTFTGLLPGQYTVYVRDEFDCGQDKFETYILTYPKFFTPNGDGINEYWRIYQSVLEPDMLVYIYDRYGKLITGFDVKSKGWDGTLNGYKLPATDYWFVVKRQNGQELKGHFSMIR